MNQVKLNDGGSLNEGMQMSEAKTEGLEVVGYLVVDPSDDYHICYVTQNLEQAIGFSTTGLSTYIPASEVLAGYAARDARIATQEAQIKELQGAETSWQSGYDEGRRMGAKHCMGTIDQLRADLEAASSMLVATSKAGMQLRAELAALNAKLDASKFCANVADDLRAELAERELLVKQYAKRMCDAEAELAAIKAQEPAFMWHKGATEDESEVVDVDCACLCCVPFYAVPVSEAKAHNRCLDEVASLYAAPVQQVSVPNGWRDGYRAAMNSAASGARQLYVQHCHHHGVNGLLDRCKELEQSFIRAADAAASAAPVQQVSVQDGFERYRLADKFCEQRLVTDDHVRAIVVDAFASGYGFGIAAAPVAKQVVMPERKWLQSDGLIYSLKSGVNYYEINVTQVEGSRHNAQRAEFARKLIDLLNAADHAEGGERTKAARDVLAERQRQVSAEGWTPEHDDKHIDCSLAAAAATYALCTSPSQLKVCGVMAWPWSIHWWKPSTYRRNLVKSGSLILAEIERIDRKQGGQDE